MWGITAGQLVPETVSNDASLGLAAALLYAVLLHTGAKLTLRRGYRDALRSRLGANW